VVQGFDESRGVPGKKREKKGEPLQGFGGGEGGGGVGGAGIQILKTKKALVPDSANRAQTPNVGTERAATGCSA